MGVILAICALVVLLVLLGAGVFMVLFGLSANDLGMKIISCAGGLLLIALVVGNFVASIQKSRTYIGPGTIVRKIHRESHTTYVMSGNVMVPINHPARWEFVIQADGKAGDEGQYVVHVDQSQYDATEVGDRWGKEGE